MRKFLFCSAAFLLLFVTGVMISFAGDIVPPDAAFDGEDNPTASMKSIDEVEPRVIISKVPFIISEGGSYYFSRNLVYTNTVATNGITIDANDVILDLKGFALITKSGSTSLDGIFVMADSEEPYERRNIVIRSGVVRGWQGDGIDAWDAVDAKVIDMKVIANGAYGIVVGDNSLVERCSSRDNQSCGIETLQGGTIKDCKSYGNGHGGPYVEGIYSDAGTRIIGCTANGNKVGIWADSYCEVSDCMTLWNETNGIHVGSSCRIKNNNCGYNIDGAGILVTGGANRIEGNNVSDNDEGIRVEGDGNLIVRNTANGNVADGIVVMGTNYYGEVMNTGQLGEDGFTNSNPWANFDY